MKEYFVTVTRWDVTIWGMSFVTKQVHTTRLENLYKVFPMKKSLITTYHMGIKFLQ